MKISICNKIYDINCVKEEENKLQSLAKRFDLKARQLGQTLGLDNEMIILLCALKLEADIDELKDKHENELLENLADGLLDVAKEIDTIKDGLKQR